MNAYLLPGILGLLLGLTLHWTGFSCPQGLRNAIGLRRSHALRSALQTLGLLLALAALLMWLAVIDVDEITVLPVTPGVLLGGALFGIAAGLCGFTPLTAFAGLGGGPAAEAVCVIAGGFLGTMLLPVLAAAQTALAEPMLAATLFRTTLDEPFLLGGGFLGQACAGALLMAIALCIPSNRREEPPEEEPEAVPETIPEETPEHEEAAPEESPDEPPESDPEAPVEPDEITLPEEPALLPGQAQQEAFIALLPGEEPLVVDTRLDETEEDEAVSDPLPEPESEEEDD